MAEWALSNGVGNNFSNPFYTSGLGRCLSLGLWLHGGSGISPYRSMVIERGDRETYDFEGKGQGERSRVTMGMGLAIFVFVSYFYPGDPFALRSYNVYFSYNLSGLYAYCVWGFPNLVS